MIWSRTGSANDFHQVSGSCEPEISAPANSSGNCAADSRAREGPLGAKEQAETRQPAAIEHSCLIGVVGTITTYFYRCRPDRKNRVAWRTAHSTRIGCGRAAAGYSAIGLGERFASEAFRFSCVSLTVIIQHPQRVELVPPQSPACRRHGSVLAARVIPCPRRVLVQTRWAGTVRGWRRSKTSHSREFLNPDGGHLIGRGIRVSRKRPKPITLHAARCACDSATSRSTPVRPFLPPQPEQFADPLRRPGVQRGSQRPARPCRRLPKPANRLRETAAAPRRTA